MSISPFDEDARKSRSSAEKIETIFRRNGIAYRLVEDGSVERVVPPVFQEASSEPDFKTGDAELDRLLTAAQRKFLDYHPDSRQEALEALWDAWERLKTLDGEGNKKAKTKRMLGKAAGPTSPVFGEALEQEARALTGLGNDLRIRHSETDREVLARSEHADYLFYRMFSLIRLILATRSSRHELPQEAHRSGAAAGRHQQGVGAGEVDPARASEHACTSGGRGDRWQRRGPCCSRSWSTTPPRRPELFADGGGTGRGAAAALPHHRGAGEVGEHDERAGAGGGARGDPHELAENLRRQSRPPPGGRAVQSRQAACLPRPLRRRWLYPAGGPAAGPGSPRERPEPRGRAHQQGDDRDSTPFRGEAAGEPRPATAVRPT